MDERDVVSAVRRALLDKVGSECFDLWLSERVQLGWTGDVLTVVAPDPFTLERLRHKLRAAIEAACREVTRESAQVEFRLATAEEMRLRDTCAGGPGSRESFLGSPVPAMKSVTARPSSSQRPAASAGMGLDARSRDGGGTGEAADHRPVRDLVSLVVGDANRIARTAAERIIERPGAISPLFLHGPSGSGKSHLLEAVIDAVRRTRKVRRAVYLSAEQFTSQFLEALQGSGLPNFRRKYRDVDMLLIDDLQFFAGKKATTVELQHTLDALQRQGRQLVLTADRPPSELVGLGHDLVARLSAGLVCPIEPADAAMRWEIVRQAARRLDLELPAEVARLLSEQLAGDVRFLLGALNRLQAASVALNEKVTPEFVLSTLTDLFRATRRVVRLPDIERAVCDVFGLDARSLQSDGKARTVSQPRMLAMWLARKHTRAALSEIGQYFGRRSHTSVISAQRKIDRLLASRAPLVVHQLECSFSDAVRRVEAQLRTGS